MVEVEREPLFGLLDDDALDRGLYRLTQVLLEIPHDLGRRVERADDRRIVLAELRKELSTEAVTNEARRRIRFILAPFDRELAGIALDLRALEVEKGPRKDHTFPHLSNRRDRCETANAAAANEIQQD